MRARETDLDWLLDLPAHAGYRLYRKRQAETELQLLEALAHAKSWEETIRLQARIEQIRVDRALPRVIEAEIRARSRS
jgi:hypothetical protein